MQQQGAISGLKNLGVSAAAALYLLHWPGAYHSDPIRWAMLGFIVLNLGQWLVDGVIRPQPFRFQLPALTPAQVAARTESHDKLATGVTLFLFTAGYLFLRTIDRNYFNQDDTFSQFGPVILQGVTSLLEKGIFPNWNPYQYMGAPVADVGTYALTYPVTYLCVAVAKYILKEPEAWAELFFLVHAVPGLLLTRRVLLRCDVTPLLSVAASLAFTFCGYNLIAGRSWFYMLPLLLTLPILSWLLIDLENFASRKWLWIAALTMGLEFHSGNSQMWLYWILFFGAGILFRFATDKTLPRLPILLRATSAVVIGLGIALPLLVPQLAFVADVKRFPLGLGHIADNLPSLLFPFPLRVATLPNNLPTHKIQYGQMYFANTLLTLTALIASASIYLNWLRKPGAKADPVTALFLFWGWLAFLLSLGEFGILWRLFSLAPPFSLFSHPYKLIQFMHFFWILAAARVLSKVTFRYDWIFPALTLLITGYHLTFCVEALWVFGDRAYHLPPALVETLKTNAHHADYFRIDTNTPHRTLKPGFINSLPLNFPTAFGIGAALGYDPLVQYAKGNRELNQQWLQARCGDREDVSPYSMMKLAFSCPPGPRISAAPLENLLRVTGVSTRLTFVRDKFLPTTRAITNYDPIIFSPQNKRIAIPFQVDSSGVHIQNPGSLPAGPLVVNFMWRKPMVATAGQMPLTVDKDQWGRMILTPPAGWKTLDVTYRPPWLLASLLGVIVFALGLLLVRLTPAMLRRSNPA